MERSEFEEIKDIVTETLISFCESEGIDTELSSFLIKVDKEAEYCFKGINEVIKGITKLIDDGLAKDQIDIESKSLDTGKPILALPKTGSGWMLEDLYSIAENMLKKGRRID